MTEIEIEESCNYYNQWISLPVLRLYRYYIFITEHKQYKCFNLGIVWLSYDDGAKSIHRYPSSRCPIVTCSVERGTRKRDLAFIVVIIPICLYII